MESFYKKLTDAEEMAGKGHEEELKGMFKQKEDDTEMTRLLKALGGKGIHIKYNTKAELEQMEKVHAGYGPDVEAVQPKKKGRKRKRGIGQQKKKKPLPPVIAGGKHNQNDDSR